MQNITRTLNKYHIRAFDLVEREDEMVVECIAECVVRATGLTKSEARAYLAQAEGHAIPKGVTVKWDVVGTVKYAMPIEQFVETATVVEEN